MKAVAETLGVARSNLIDGLKGRTKPRRRNHEAQDSERRTPCVRESRERGAVDHGARVGAPDRWLPAEWPVVAVAIVAPPVRATMATVECATNDVSVPSRVNSNPSLQ